MTTEAGVWIDHRKAVIATLSDKTEALRQVASNVEKHVRYSGAGRDEPAENQQDRRFAGHLNRYYDEVVAYLREADSILIFGPGEAKAELEVRLDHAGLRARIVGVEAADKLTDPQIAARVRQHFLNSPRRLQRPRIV